MKKVIVLLLCSIVSIEMLAQRRVVVVDMDTNVPIRDVSVKIDSHLRYEHERLTMTEVGDTMFLLPKEHTLPEVTISELDPRVKGLISGWAREGAMQGAAEAPRGNITIYFDFANMLDRRGRRDRKHLERAKKILKEWDEKPDETK